jgi:glutaminase
MNGRVADYIPQLATVNPDLIGLSFCDVSGNRFSLGDSTTPFSLQSCCKPLSYCLARTLEDAGEGPRVHDHVGYEPSGRAFNEFVLNRDNLPHNPLINAGAIMVTSLLNPKREAAERFDKIKQFIHSMGGNMRGLGFDNSIFLSEKHHADRNISLAYYMRENGAYYGYPTPSELDEHMDLYFQSCAITVDCEIAAVIAATLSNHGTCPITDETVVQRHITKDALSIMFMCGLYDFSGQFAFEFGLPAKSGVSGALLLCIPNIGGICIWSPRLDEIGNTIRGVNFCREFTNRSRARYHIFNNTMELRKPDLPTDKELPLDMLVQRCIKCAIEDDKQELEDVMRTFFPTHRLEGETDNALVCRMMSMSDHDKRTPLHFAASRGNIDMVEFFLEMRVDCNAKDRWGNTPVHCAIKQLHSAEAPVGSLHGQTMDGSYNGGNMAIDINMESLMRVVAALDDEMKKQGIVTTSMSRITSSDMLNQLGDEVTFSPATRSRSSTGTSSPPVVSYLQQINEQHELQSSFSSSSAATSTATASFTSTSTSASAGSVTVSTSNALNNKPRESPGTKSVVGRSPKASNHSSSFLAPLPPK